jgi:hypothetical protein
MIRVAGALCAWLTIFCNPAFAAARCWLPPMAILANQTTQRDMLVVSGKPCSLVVVRSTGPMYTAHLIAAPSSGHVSIQGARVTYVSRSGYVGDDHFIFSREGINGMNQRATWTVEMNVHVRDRL